jgi:hypothetical protein
MAHGRALSALSLCAVASVLAVAPSASASSLMGSDLDRAGNINLANRIYVGLSAPAASTVPVTAPVSGVLVAMKVHHGPDPSGVDQVLRFRIFTGTYTSSSATFSARPATPDGSTATGLPVAANAPAGIDTYLPKDSAGDPVGVPIDAGERLALYAQGTLPIMYGITGDGSEAGYNSGDQTSGSALFNAAAREAMIQGVIEPDADGDHYGDETQDGCTTDPAIHKTACPSGAPGPGPGGEGPGPTPTGPTAGPDTINGTAAADALCGLGGDDTINGLGGNDILFGDQCNAIARLTSAPFAAAADDGNDTIDGGAGNDRLYGSGKNDVLKGGPGNDLLNGGKGKNRYSGGAGNDKIAARNHKRDRIDCGKGRRDRATVDKADKVRGCERVKRH